MSQYWARATGRYVARKMRYLLHPSSRLSDWRWLLGWPVYLIFVVRCCFENRGSGTPTRYQTARWLLRCVRTVADRNETTLWCFHGTLLGAVRSGSFAGRPGDLDFIVSPNELPQFISDLRRELIESSSLVSTLHRFGLVSTRIHRKARESRKTYVFLYIGFVRCIVLEFTKYRRCFVGNTEAIELPSSFGSEVDVLLSAQDFDVPRKATICGVDVRIPANAEYLLSDIYGSDWRVPARRVRHNSEKRGLGYRDPSSIR